MTERFALSTRLQAITHAPYGHFLNHRQIFSPDGTRVYFDTRNADPEIQRTCRIESIEWRSGDVRVEYAVPRPNEHGPGVGAVVCHPQREALLFIHGLHNCDSDRPYGMTRRFGALLDASFNRLQAAATREPMRPELPVESRYVTSVCPRGGLRGGTHAHSWSHDGRWVSFTYNDAVVASRHACGNGPPDRRTVGAIYLPRLDAFAPAFCNPHALERSNACEEEWTGLGWGTVVARVADAPRPGSDDIELACEECWVEHRPLRTLAFLGRVRDARGNAIDEVFVAEWRCEDCVGGSNRVATTDREGRLEPCFDQEGDPVRTLRTRRVTRSEADKYPGVSGPRNWLIASPDGQFVYFPKRDDRGLVQIARAELDTGHITMISQLSQSIENQLTLDTKGRRISAICGGVPGVLEIESGVWQPLLLKNTADGRTIGAHFSGAVHFLPNDSGWIMHGYPSDPEHSWLQLWTLTLH